MFQVIFTGDGFDEKMRTGTAAGISHSGCYGHSCGELDQRALLAVAVALLATGVERLWQATACCCKRLGMKDKAERKGLSA